MKSISKGMLENQSQYNYSYFVYSNVSNKDSKTRMNSCRVYLADIRSGRNQILEKIVFYSCSNQAPFKIVLDYNEKGMMTGKHYFLSLKDSTYAIAATVQERLLLMEMSKHQMPDDYTDYPQISGFRPAIPADSIEELPFLKDVANGKLM